MIDVLLPIFIVKVDSPILPILQDVVVPSLGVRAEGLSELVHVGTLPLGGPLAFKQDYFPIRSAQKYG